MRLLTLILFLTILTDISAQMRITPLPREKNRERDGQARTETTHLPLPFWDDFSYDLATPSANKWQEGSNVWISAGSAINPPTLHTATFDGVDGNGQPYSLDASSDGPTDKLVSRLFDLSGFATDDSVFLSFFVEARGRGEIPNRVDSLGMDWQLGDGTWERVWSVRGEDIPLDTFQLVALEIDQSRFLHADFAFRFQAYGRQTGPYDVWHIDYVYLNHGVSDFYFPDRSLQSPASSPFGAYTHIPIEHYRNNPGLFSSLSIATAYNLHDKLQPTNFSLVAEIGNYDLAGNISISRDTLAKEVLSSFPDPLISGTRQIELQASSALNSNLVTSDTLTEVKLKLYMNTDDNNPPDYITDVYSPLDFTVNDTVYSSFFLADQYAYDDGTAEYGAGLNYPSDLVVVEFPVEFDQSDTLVSVDFHFPQIGVSDADIIDLVVMNSRDGRPDLIIYEQTVRVQRATTLNEFHTYEFETPVVIRDTFFLGWRQESAGVVDVGLDKNNDNASRIYFNLDGNRQQNTTVRGSLMLRPRFGTGDLILGKESYYESDISVYPNPGYGNYRISQRVDNIRVFDAQGRQVPAVLHQEGGFSEVHIGQQPGGLYILVITVDGRLYHHRILKM